MKRTLQWSVLFTLLLCFILIPFMTQKAAAADYDLWVNGTQVTDENKADIPFEGTGKASYDDSTKTLTFENAVFTKSDFPVIQAQDDLIVTGQVQYTGTKGGILADKSLTIVGSDTNINVTAPTAIIAGSLTVEDGTVTASGGIETTGEIVINDGNVTASGEKYGIYADREATGAPHNITISGGTVTASQSENGSFGDSGAAIRATGDVIISGGKVEATADGKYAFAILADGDNGIDISGAEVKAAFTAYDGTGLQANGGDVKISNSSKVDIPCTANIGFRGIFTPNGGVFISGGSEVKITGPTIGIYAMPKNVEVTGEGTVLTVNNGLGESILVQLADFVVKDATVNITGSAVWVGYDVELENAKVTVSASLANSGLLGADITVKDSTLDVTAKETGIEGKSLAISGASTLVKAKGGTSAIALFSGSGIITIDPLLTIRKPTDGTLGTDKKQVYKSGGTTPATEVEIGKKITAYPLWVNGVQVTSENKDNIPCDSGYGEFDPETLTLTFHDAVITKVYKYDSNFVAGVVSVCTDMLTVKGSVTVNSPSRGIMTLYGLTISGEDTVVNVSVSGEYSYGISDSSQTALEDNDCRLCIEGGEVNVTVTNGIAGICARMIEISGGQVNVHGVRNGILAYKDLSISGGTVTARMTGEDSFGLNANGGSITISGESTVVTAEGAIAVYARSRDDKTVPNISIADPLAIFEPAGGYVGDPSLRKGGLHDYYTRSICNFDDTAATHVVIKKFDPAADGLLYTVTWRNYDGSVYEVDALVPYGTLPTYDGETPTRPAYGGVTYTFSGWTPDVEPVSGDVTYTASFTSSGTPGPGPGYIPGYMPGITPGSGSGGSGGSGSGGSGSSGGSGGSGSSDGSGGSGSGGSGSGGSGSSDGSGSSGGAVTPGDLGLPFTDLSADSPYLTDIAYVYEKGLMFGMSETEFGEELPLTRGMIVTILHRMEGKPAVTYSGVFTDVPDGMWYTDGVEWAASHEIVVGYGDGRYGPDDLVTREQLAAILFRYAKYKGYDVSIGEDTNILSYDDAFDISGYAFPAMQWACGTDVLNSAGTALIRPRVPATRGEIAHAIRIFCEKVAK